MTAGLKAKAEVVPGQCLDIQVDKRGDQQEKQKDQFGMMGMAIRIFGMWQGVKKDVGGDEQQCGCKDSVGRPVAPPVGQQDQGKEDALSGSEEEDGGDGEFHILYQRKFRGIVKAF